MGRLCRRVLDAEPRRQLFAPVDALAVSPVTVRSAHVERVKTVDDEGHAESVVVALAEAASDAFVESNETVNGRLARRARCRGSALLTATFSLWSDPQRGGRSAAIAAQQTKPVALSTPQRHESQTAIDSRIDQNYWLHFGLDVFIVDYLV